MENTHINNLTRHAPQKGAPQLARQEGRTEKKEKTVSVKQPRQVMIDRNERS
jgi:hypothetical protein